MLFYALFRNDPRVVALAAGSPLIVKGEPADLMYVLIRGRAKVQLGDITVEHLKPGSIVGEMALVDRTPHSASVVAETACEFVCIDEARFKFLIAETPGFAVEVIRTLAIRLRTTDQLLERCATGVVTES